MNNNDFLRRLRYALKISDTHAAKLFSKDPANAVPMDADGFRARIARQEEPNFKALSDLELAAFLDGLIADKRGLREGGSLASPTPRISKNEVLKKLRIAFAMRDDDMLHVLKKGGSALSKTELSALFRAPGHKHYRGCGDQVIRAFLMGLTKDDDE